MSNDEKIEVAEKRILELETLINYWRVSDISATQTNLDIVDSMLSPRFERKTAY